MFIILIVVTDSWIYLYVKTHHTIHFIYVQFMVHHTSIKVERRGKEGTEKGRKKESS